MSEEAALQKQAEEDAMAAEWAAALSEAKSDPVGAQQGFLGHRFAVFREGCADGPCLLLIVLDNPLVYIQQRFAVRECVVKGLLHQGVKRRLPLEQLEQFDIQCNQLLAQAGL